MILIEILILAVTQALTEFLPVSSSGHLLALDEVAGIDSSLAIDVMLHVGTLLALVIYFWPKLFEIAKNVLSGRDYKLFTLLVISTIPAAVVGFLFNDFFSEDVRHVEVVIVMLVLVGLLFIASDRLFPPKFPQKKGKEIKLSQISKKTALIVGVAQAAALIPGTSRSGITILAGRSQGLDNRNAAEYSFLIGVPVIFGASVQTLLDDEARAAVTDDLALTVVGILTAAIVGLGVVHWLLKYLKSHGLAIFGYYRIALALVLLLLINI